MTDKIIISCPNCGKDMRVPTGKHIKFVCPDCNENLEYNDIEAVKKNSVEDDATNGNDGGCLASIAVAIISFIVVIPLFILLDRYLPDLDWVWNLDRILLFIITYTIVEAIFESLKILSIIILVIAIGWLSYGSIWGSYGFRSVYEDYRSLIYNMEVNPNPVEDILDSVKPFPYKSKFKKAIDYQNAEVRNYAIEATNKYFTSYQDNNRRYREYVQYFAVFKEINSHWHYVNDPASREYFAKASETIKLSTISGDCDDHSILMAAAIKSIGGTVRLVITNEHVYPELLVEKEDIDNIIYLINNDLFPQYDSYKRKKNNYLTLGGKKYKYQTYETSKRIKNTPLHYHTDNHGRCWLNLDYTEDYPGGHFLDNDVIATWIVD